MRSLVWALALGWLLAWVLGTIQAPLPNANAAKQVDPPLTRAGLLLRTIPTENRGASIPEQAWMELSQPANLVERLPVVATGLLILGSALAIGRLTLRVTGLSPGLNPAESLAVSGLIGLPLLACMTMLIGRVAVPGAWPTKVGLCLPMVVEIGFRVSGWFRSKQRSGPQPDREIVSDSLGSPGGSPWSGALSMTVLTIPVWILLALGAMLPTLEFDALEYHLQGPREYWQLGRVQYLPHNVYTSMPFGVEMFHLLGIIVLDDPWLGVLAGKFLIGVHVALAALIVGLIGTRLDGPLTGWTAATIISLTPWTYVLGTSAFVEGPLLLYHAGAIWAAMRAWQAKGASGWRWWWVVGLATGGAFTCKYPGLISAMIPFTLVSLAGSIARRSVLPAISLTVGMSALTAPWLVKNLIETGNPVYPLASDLFGGAGWDETLRDRWQQAHGPRPRTLGLLVQDALNILGRHDYQAFLYSAWIPLIALRWLPITGVRKLSKTARVVVLLLLVNTVYLLATWWLLTHRVDRFWLPVLPSLAVLAGLGATWMAGPGWSACRIFGLAVAALLCWILIVTPLAGLNRWTASYHELRETFPGRVNPPLAMMDERIPDGQRVLILGQAQVFFVESDHLYSTVFNHSPLEAVIDQAQGSAERVAQGLENLGVDLIYVDWDMIARYRSEGNYGFSPLITRERLTSWVEAGILGPPRSVWPRYPGSFELYSVRGAPKSSQG